MKRTHIITFDEQHAFIDKLLEANVPLHEKIVNCRTTGAIKNIDGRAVALSHSCNMQGCVHAQSSRYELQKRKIFKYYSTVKVNDYILVNINVGFQNVKISDLKKVKTLLNNKINSFLNYTTMKDVHSFFKVFHLNFINDILINPHYNMIICIKKDDTLALKGIEKFVNSRVHHFDIAHYFVQDKGFQITLRNFVNYAFHETYDDLEPEQYMNLMKFSKYIRYYSLSSGISSIKIPRKKLEGNIQFLYHQNPTGIYYHSLAS